MASEAGHTAMTSNFCMRCEGGHTGTMKKTFVWRAKVVNAGMTKNICMPSECGHAGMTKNICMASDGGHAGVMRQLLYGERGRSH